MGIDRYSVSVYECDDYCDYDTVPDDMGYWVKFSDAEKAIKELEERNEALRKALDLAASRLFEEGAPMFMVNEACDVLGGNL